MKKTLTGILALSLAASMSVPAFAANSATNNGTAGSDIAVNGKYQAGAAAAEVISVDLVWDEMNFTYTAPSRGTWNATDHKYENATAGGWTATNGADPKITVTNHSNVAVKASFSFTTGVDGLNGNFTSDSLALATAENTTFDNAPTGETAFSVSGTAIDADKTIGTIVVTVAKDDSEAMYKVTAEQFANLMATSDNFTVTTVTGGYSFTIYFGGRSVMADALLSDSYNGIYTFDGTNYYCYTQEEKDGDWLLENDEAELYNHFLQRLNILPYLKDSYTSFAYDAATHTYITTSKFGNVTEASICFENGALKSASVTLVDGTVYSYSECGTTVVEIPTNIHEHTYADTWSFDYNYHWHAATCRHSDKGKDYADHNWVNDVCTICGYDKNAG